MNERLKELRNELKLTQQQFADVLHISRNNIGSYEAGKSSLSDAVILLICNVFNVNEEWLRTGNGPMFNENASFNLDEFAARHGATADEIELLKIYFEMDPKTRKDFIEHFKKHFNVSENEKDND